MTPELQRQIDLEAAACRKAHAEYPQAKAYWCWHHKLRLELSGGRDAMIRIHFILANKPEGERIIRLCNFRPMIGVVPSIIQTEIDRIAAIYQPQFDEYMDGKREADARRILEEWNQSIPAAINELPEIARLHDEQVPHHTWNGKDIL